MHFPARALAVPFCTVVMLAAACASGGSGVSRQARACALRATDSAFARSGPVYRECAVEREADLRTRDIRPDYRPTGTNGCVSTVLEFVVGTDGSVETGTVRIARSNDQTFSRAIIAVLPRYRYTPALLNGAPVRQIVTLDQSVVIQSAVVTTGSGPPTAAGRPPC
jgi:hypothetical protein